MIVGSQLENAQLERRGTGTGKQPFGDFGPEGGIALDCGEEAICIYGRENGATPNLFKIPLDISENVSNEVTALGSSIETELNDSSLITYISAAKCQPPVRNVGSGVAIDDELGTARLYTVVGGSISEGKTSSRIYIPFDCEIIGVQVAGFTLFRHNGTVSSTATINTRVRKNGSNLVSLSFSRTSSSNSIYQDELSYTGFNGSTVGNSFGTLNSLSAPVSASAGEYIDVYTLITASAASFESWSLNYEMNNCGIFVKRTVSL